MIVLQCRSMHDCKAQNNLNINAWKSLELIYFCSQVRTFLFSDVLKNRQGKFVFQAGRIGVINIQIMHGEKNNYSLPSL